MTDLKKYKSDIKDLITRGLLLRLSIRYETVPEKMEPQGLSDDEIKKLPKLADEYQKWYTEALACLKQLLPERVGDFVSYYKPDRVRKEITYANYTMIDFLKGLKVTRGYDVVVGPDAAMHSLDQQVQIVAAMEKRFESSLFDIRALAQADLFDNELDATEALTKNGFGRAAGMIAGVVLEGHLGEVCQRHGVAIKKKKPTISDFNDRLKAQDVLETSMWRFIQHLADIRNKCGHKKSAEPSAEEVADLIAGVRKVTKTVF